MVHARSKRKASARRPDALTIATALERARLRRAVQAKREIARRVVELRRAADRANRALLQLAMDVARQDGAEWTYPGKGIAPSRSMRADDTLRLHLDDKAARPGASE